MENVQKQNTTTQQEGTRQELGMESKSSQEQQQEKLFTQDEVDRIVGNRLARMKQDLGTSDTYRRERDEARQELERYKNEAFLKGQGVTDTYLDYVMFRAMQQVDDNNSFQQAAAKFLKDNPVYTGKGFRVASTGLPSSTNLGKGGVAESDIRKAMGLK